MKASGANVALDASTFNACVRSLPHDLQTDIRLLYRILRTIDDLVDNQDPQAEQRVEAIERWLNNREADTPETQILANLANRHLLATEAMIEFCQGMRHDLTHTTVGNEEDLERYCQLVGGAVGIMLARIFGSSDPDCERKMATLGRAAQRTNILRDIDEDHANGRLYLASTTIKRFGPPSPGNRKQLLRDQIARADRLYEEGLDAIPLLPRGRRSMDIAVTLYREILRQIERDGYGRSPGRAVVPPWRIRLLVAEHRLRLRGRQRRFASARP